MAHGKDPEETEETPSHVQEHWEYSGQTVGEIGNATFTGDDLIGALAGEDLSQANTNHD